MSHSSLHHSFDTEIATIYGVPEAIIIHHFQHWIMVNKRLKQNLHDGRTWTYQTLAQIAAHFPYLSVDQVKRIINKLCDNNVLMKGNYNQTPYDRTVWYAFVNENIFSIWRNRQIEIPKPPNQDGQTATPIPDTKTDTKEKRERESTTTQNLAAPEASHALSSFFISELEKHHPSPDKKDLQGWESILKKILEEKNVTDMKLKKLVTWVFSAGDGFWISNVRNPWELKKNFDTILSQFENQTPSKEKVAADQDKIRSDMSLWAYPLQQESHKITDGKISVLTTGVEVIRSGKRGFTHFTDSDFKEKIIRLLNNWNIKIKGINDGFIATGECT